jgi:hypothetical protein
MVKRIPKGSNLTPSKVGEGEKVFMVSCMLYTPFHHQKIHPDHKILVSGISYNDQNCQINYKVFVNQTFRTLVSE